MSNQRNFVIPIIIIALFGLIYGVSRLSSQQNGMDGPPPGLPKTPPVTYNEVALQKAWPLLIKNSASPTPFGNAKAPYTLLEIGDFQCPNCGAAVPLVKTILTQSRGKAKLYFFNFPLQSLHPHALIAAQASLSAAAQGKFWPMYDSLYAHQDQLIDSEIEYNARTIPGLNVNQLQSDLTTQKFMPDVARQAQIASTIGIQSVPTLLVRSPDGNISWYVGSKGDAKVPGIAMLAAKLPWGASMSQKDIHQLLTENTPKDGAG